MRHRKEEWKRYPDRRQLWIDDTLITSVSLAPELRGTFWTVADMHNAKRIAELERILDVSNIAGIRRADDGEPLRRNADRFSGILSTVIGERYKHPLGAYFMSTSGGKFAFTTRLTLKDKKPQVNPKGIDYGYSSLSFRLSRKELEPQEVDAFKRLFVNVCVACDSFYGRAGEDSMYSQRSILMAKAVEDIGRRKRAPDFERELWDVYWLNYFGPAFVKHWGEEKIAALAEHYEVMRFKNGGFCMQTTPEPVISDDSAKSITDYAFKKPCYEILGYNTFMHETHQQGEKGQHVPTMEQHRRALEEIEAKRT